MAKYSKRTVRVTQQHNEECRRLLRLMGVPVVVVRALASCQLAEASLCVQTFLERLLQAI